MLDATKSHLLLLAGLLVLSGCADAPLPAEPAELAASDALLAQGRSHNEAVPEEAPGPPYYSPLGNGLIATDGEWVAIPFIRDPACANDSNLYAPTPAAFSCALTVEGHQRWQDGKWDDGMPWDGMAPRQTQFRGLGGVPVMFVLLAELAPELTDGTLLLSELLALPSLRQGSASFYKETNILGLSGPHGIGRGTYTINARGPMVGEPGTFSLLVNEVRGELVQVEIDLP